MSVMAPSRCLCSGPFPEKREKHQRSSRIIDLQTQEEFPDELETIRQAAWSLIRSKRIFSIDDWMEVENMAFFWLNYNTIESVEVMFRLLDRLELELRRLRSLRSPPWLNADLLEDIVDKWYHVTEQKPNHDEYLSPQQVFRKTRSYVEVFFRMKWSSSIATTISAAHAHRSLGSTVDPTFCDEIVAWTVEEWKLTQEPSVRPTTELLQTALEAWSKQDAYDSSSVITSRFLSKPAQKVDDLLFTMEKVVGLTPSNQNYETMVHIFARSRSTRGAERAQQLVLEDMHSAFLSSGDPCWSWSSAFASAIEAWAWVDDSIQAMQNTKFLLQKYEELRNLGHLDPHENDFLVYHAAMHALSAVGTIESAQKADEILCEIGHTTKPSQESCIWVISALANVGLFDQAERIISKMMHCPPIGAYFALLRGMSEFDHDMLLPKARQVYELLSTGCHHSGPRANTQVYNQFLQSFIGSGNQASTAWLEKARFALEVFEFLNSSLLKGEKDRRPDRETYSQIMRCWAILGKPDLALHWLEKMRKEYRNGNQLAAPQVVDCNRVLEGYLRAATNAKSAAANAECFLYQISEIKSRGKYLKPNVTSYELVFKCLAKKGGREAAEKSLRLLKSMTDISGLSPNSACYNTVIELLAKSGSPDEADEILSDMLLYGDATSEPDVNSFNSCLKAWADSGRSESPEKCEKLVSRMINLYAHGFRDLQPDLESLSSLMLSYCRSNHPGAPRRAQEVFKKMLVMEKKGKYGPIDRSLFQILVTAWEDSDEPGKDEIIRFILNDMDSRFVDEEPVTPRTPLQLFGQRLDA